MSETAYTVEVDINAARELADIQDPNRKRILARIRSLAVEPRPDGVVKLAGLSAYRLRVGDYRIVYTIEDSIRVVSVTRIAHRSNVYQDRK